MSAAKFEQIRALAVKLASELVFAEPGNDNGLLPINSLLGQLEELAADQTLAAGLVPARECIDEVFGSTGKFDAPAIERLGEWVTWFQSAIAALENGRSVPRFTFEAKPSTASAPPASKKVATESRDEALAPNWDDDGELLGEFLNESQEHLQNIENGVLVLEENPADSETLNSIFRAFHTFKGGSGFLNLTVIQAVAHELESLLDLARQGKLEITPGIIDLILEGGDLFKRFSSEIAARLSGKQPRTPILIPTSAFLARIRAVLAADRVCSEAPGGAPATPTPSQSEGAAAALTNAPPATAVKVDVAKLDNLVDMVGELVIAQSLVVQNPELRGIATEQLTRNLAQLGRITKELQRSAMALRMVPIRGTFQKMSRVVRDVSAKLHKDVTLATDGEETELDRTIVEELSDPLIHMIRNAVDHGIETRGDREAKGKPAHGTIALRAFHQGGNIVIEVKDDGKGLDRERILARAIEKGLAEPGAQLSEQQIFQLIFAPGFSTAAEVSDLSGRGVGMDVVRRNIEKLRGKIEIQSAPGEGSTFSIYLPLTLAIIDGLLVGVGEHRFIIPTLLVRESFRPAEGAIHTIHDKGEMISVRGSLFPLVRLNELFGFEPRSREAGDSIVVVVEAGESTRCVLVDRLVGKQEVVIKSLSDAFRRNPYISGAAILGDGRVGLILDPQALVQLVPFADAA